MKLTTPENAYAMSKRHGLERQTLLLEQLEDHSRLTILHALEHEDLYGELKHYRHVASVLKRQTQEIIDLKSVHWQRRIVFEQRQFQEREALKKKLAGSIGKSPDRIILN